MQGFFQYSPINTIHINKLKNKNCTIISIKAEKSSDKILQKVYDNSSSRKEIYLKIIKAMYDKPMKEAEHQIIDAFELWCWRRLLRVPWTARRSNQSVLKEISPEYSLEELMLKLKLQYFGHLMRRANSLEKAVVLGKTGIPWWLRQ